MNLSSSLCSQCRHAMMDMVILIIFSLITPLSSCSSDEDGSGLSNDSINVVFHVHGINTTGYQKLSVLDYAGGAFVKSGTYRFDGNDAQIELSLRLGKHRIVFCCLPESSGCSFDAEKALLSINEQSPLWMSDVWSVQAETLDLSVTTGVSPITVNLSQQHSSLQVYSTDHGNIASTVIMVESYPYTLSLLDDSYKSKSLSAHFLAGPPCIVPVVTPERGLSGVSVTIRAVDVKGIESIRRIKGISLQRYKTTYLVGPLEKGSDSDWKIFEEGDSVEMRKFLYGYK